MSPTNDSTATRPTRASWIALLVAIGICLLVVLRVLAPFASVLLLAVVAAALIYRHYQTPGAQALRATARQPPSSSACSCW